MPIWVDADACPKVIKEILFRAAERTAVRVTLVANRLPHTPPSPYISARQVTEVVKFPVAMSVVCKHIFGLRPPAVGVALCLLYLFELIF
jgi:uncharacterized protein YaiI (UPF0178 family)